MPTKAEKEELHQVREQFRKDFSKLREKYENLELANMTGIDPGNLSKYGSGILQPGLTVLQQFYTPFAREMADRLKKINTMVEKKKAKSQQWMPTGKKRSAGQKANANYNSKATESKETDDKSNNQMYANDEAGLKEANAILKTQNEHLRSAQSKMLDSSDKIFQLPYRWFESFDRMVQTHDRSTQAALLMAQTHQKVIDSFLQQKGGKEKPNG